MSSDGAGSLSRGTVGDWSALKELGGALWDTVRGTMGGRILYSKLGGTAGGWGALWEVRWHYGSWKALWRVEGHCRPI